MVDKSKKSKIVTDPQANAVNTVFIVWRYVKKIPAQAGIM